MMFLTFFPEPFSGKFRHDFSIKLEFFETILQNVLEFQNFRITDKKVVPEYHLELWNNGTFFILEMEKKFRIISGPM